MTNVTITDKLTAAFAALRAYGCDNINELDALLGDDIGWLSWDELADKIIEALKGQAELLRDEAETIRATKLAKAALIDEILGGA